MSVVAEKNSEVWWVAWIRKGIYLHRKWWDVSRILACA